MKAVDARTMRTIESSFVQAGGSLRDLMQRAGEAVAHEAQQICPQGTILVVVGPGNNGGDGIIAAEALRSRGREVTVYAFRRPDTSPFAGPVTTAESDEYQTELRRLVAFSALVVDAVFGMGQTRNVEGQAASIVETINDARGDTSRVLAVDVPTGVDSDTGAVLGTAVRADCTLCTGVAKIGAAVFPGAAYTGEMKVDGIGLPDGITGEVGDSITDSATAAALLPIRELDSNKGSSGRVTAVCGSHDFTGAPVFVSLGAYRAGAGLVALSLPDRILVSVAARALEPIFQPLEDEEGKLGPGSAAAIDTALEKAKAYAIGPGMGLSEATIGLLTKLLETLRKLHHVPGVIDADGLNALSHITGWHIGLPNLIVTPHPGEMSRLTGLSIDEIQKDRIATARRFSQSWGVTVVLKGARTVVAAPSGAIAINLSGGPNLATAGTGDVLTGIISGLLAQGLKAWDAARAGAFLHGHAGDLWRAQHGDAGMLASDLLDLVPAARQSILQTKGSA